MARAPFERVVTRHGGTVLRVCRALLPVADADDAWSETFLAALRAYPDLPADANVEAWLVTIAHRKTLDVLRARGRRAVPVADVPDAPSSRGIPSEPADELWAAVRALPDRQRHAVAYHHVAGLAYQQVADVIGGTPEAARRAAADGIRTLRRTVLPPATPETAPAPTPETAPAPTPETAPEPARPPTPGPTPQPEGARS